MGKRGYSTGSKGAKTAVRQLLVPSVTMKINARQVRPIQLQGGATQALTRA